MFTCASQTMACTRPANQPASPESRDEPILMSTFSLALKLKLFNQLMLNINKIVIVVLIILTKDKKKRTNEIKKKKKKVGKKKVKYCNHDSNNCQKATMHAETKVLCLIKRGTNQRSPMFGNTKNPTTQSLFSP